MDIGERSGVLPTPLSQTKGQDQAGKPGATAEIDKAAGGRGNMGQKLGGIQHVAAPGIGQGGGAHQIDGPLPAAELLQIKSKASGCFT